MCEQVRAAQCAVTVCAPAQCRFLVTLAVYLIYPYHNALKRFDLESALYLRTCLTRKDMCQGNGCLILMNMVMEGM